MPAPEVLNLTDHAAIRAALANLADWRQLG